MTVAVLVGVFCVVMVAGMVRPFLATRHLAPPPAAADTRAPRSLLRQLRDLDDDLASGRVSEADHRRLRGVLERQAADALRESTVSVPHSRVPVAAPDHRTGALLSARSRWVRRGVGLTIGALAAVGVTALLLAAVDQRPVSTGDPSAAAASPSPTAPVADPLTSDQLGEVEAAVRLVKDHPRQAAAHVELARAYTTARQPQLAAVEYLAATRLDPANPEANTALALVAFKAGNARQADALVSKALLAHPGHPEALYTRGLIRAMGLHQPAAATRDLEAYQHAAPTGSHRTTVATVLALLASGAIR
jgi:tetratricopeptide (TPR) repeat protein